MTQDDVGQAIRDLDLTLLPFTHAHAHRYFTLPQDHTDPFDRMLIATAFAEDVPVITNDRAFDRYPGLRTIW